MALANSRALCLLLVSLALWQAVSGTLTSDIQKAFKEITTLSDNLRISTEKITIFNAPQQGPTISIGFGVIINSIAQASDELSGSKDKPLGDDDAKLVVESLTKFVKVHQALLNVVIGKHGLLTLVPFFEPIRLTLVSLEAVVDSFAFSLIEKIPTQKDAAQQQFSALSVTVTDAISTYTQSFKNSELPSELPLAKGIAAV